MKGVCVLGSTGSIGVSTLDVLRINPEAFSIVALSANKNITRLFEQCIEFKPSFAVVPDEKLANDFKALIDSSSELETVVLSGASSLDDVAEHDDVDIVVAAIVGAAGLLSTMAAAKAGKRILLANKESLVVSGDLLIAAVNDNQAELLPLDSEHNALFQCMPAGYRTGQRALGIRKIILTASGGPFLNKTKEELQHVTVEEACAHPNWTMGRKISVDSASMMNKGLEVIEASFLFNMKACDIVVLVHPQSIIHSMVDYVDGSVLAQLGNPDMKTPIAHALAWPERQDSGVSALDFIVNNSLSFQAPSYESFPCLRLAFEALESKGTAPAILNAANEIAVDAFLNERVRFNDIPAIIEQVLNQMPITAVASIDEVIDVDVEARAIALTEVGRVS